MLGYYLDHQKDVVTRRTKYDLNKAEERAHILEGLLIALDNIDEVINIIRSSANTPEAKNRLIERFSLTDVQAQAIVDMRLRALTGLEREKIEAEYAELMDRIAELKAILADEKKLLGVCLLYTSFFISKIRSVIETASSPLILTIPIPELVIAVAIAAMVSVPIMISFPCTKLHAAKLHKNLPYHFRHFHKAL